MSEQDRQQSPGRNSESVAASGASRVDSVLRAELAKQDRLLDVHDTIAVVLCCVSVRMLRDGFHVDGTPIN